VLAMLVPLVPVASRPEILKKALAAVDNIETERITTLKVGSLHLRAASKAFRKLRHRANWRYTLRCQKW
jgi:hypothetical protein